MAIVTGPLHSSEARGAVGALVYNTYRGRAYVKARSTPLLEYTDPQIAAREMMNEVHFAWAALSDEQRDAWSQYAKDNHGCDWTGQLKTLSPWNWYAKIGYLIYNNFGITPTLPPNPVTSYQFATLQAAQVGPNIEITWSPVSPSPSPEWMIETWVTAPHAATVHPSPKLAKRYLSDPEFWGATSFFPSAPGFYTLYLRPVSLVGCTMPMTRLVVEVT